MRQYERCAAALKEELEVQPSRQTVELYEQICTDKLQGNMNSSGQIPSAEPAFSSLSDLFSRLKKVREVLLSLQKQIQDDIHILDKALDSCPTRKGSNSEKRFPASTITGLFFGKKNPKKTLLRTPNRTQGQTAVD